MVSETDKGSFDKPDNTTLLHYYRGEVGKMNTWRRRLDVTTNRAIRIGGISCLPDHESSRPDASLISDKGLYVT